MFSFCSFAVSSELVESFLEGSTLDKAIENKKIFIVNHVILDGILDAQSNNAVSV